MQHLGTKFKNFVSAESGVLMLWLEIQEGRHHMRPKKEYFCDAWINGVLCHGKKGGGCNLKVDLAGVGFVLGYMLGLGGWGWDMGWFSEGGGVRVTKCPDMLPFLLQ
eukprot:scaffold20223_cov64-Attheya_sp.AAC.5